MSASYNTTSQACGGEVSAFWKTGHDEADRLIGLLLSAEQDLDLRTDAAILLRRLVVEEIRGPAGFATWREAAAAARAQRVRLTATSPFAAPVIPTDTSTERLRAGLGRMAARVLRPDKVDFDASLITIAREVDEMLAATPARAADADRYQQLRRGQNWSVVDGVGNTLQGESLDAAISAARRAGEAR